ncbi:unnamed protein product, partial [Rotaria socialis]
MSKIVPKIEQILQDEGREKRIDEVRFIALCMLDIDYDLKNSHWHGFNIFVMAAKVNVSTKCEWNLSGVSSRKHYEKASSGSSCGDDGQDGKDGYCGESSGNVMILAEEMQNAHNLAVTLNGGDGSGGQEGGDGANGQDGTGTTMSELNKEYSNPTPWLFNHNFATLFNKISSKGKVETRWKKHPNRYIEVKLHNGQKIIYSLSRYGDFQCYLLYKGSKGEQGGRGGLNGLGGGGGFQGECLVVSKENKSFPVHIKSAKGSKGQNAKPGRTGEYGKNGWDVGYTDYQYWGRAHEFGTGHNQRLSMNYSASSSDRVYCGYRYDVLGSSACYATINASVLEHRKLTDSEKLRETRKEGERRKKAVATLKNFMLQKAMEKTYGKYFETGDCLMNTVAEMRAENMMNFNMMHRKAKKAFEEVESLKEGSREKQCWSNGKKLDIIANIENNPDDASVWIKLCDEEFSIDELRKVERHFNNFQTQQKIDRAEITWIPRKFGLARFCGIINDAYQLEINQNKNLNNDFNSEKYLKISEQSYSDLEWLREFQDETLQNRNIEDTFHDLCQYQLSTSDLNIVETNYKKLVSIKIGTETLEEFLNSWQTDDNQSFAKLSTLKGNKTEWGKVLEVFDSFRKTNLTSEALKKSVPLYDEKELKNDNGLLKYLFDLWNSLYTLKTTNTTLAKMIEWLIIENDKCKNPPSQIQEYLKLEKKFMDAKSNSLNNLLLAIQCLSHRLPKASWQHSYEYPNFFLPKKTQNISEDMQHIDNKLLEKLYNIYTNKQNETIDWHKKIDKILLDICLKQMLSNKTIAYAPLLELIAWKHGLNIRTYQKTNYAQLVCNREHFVCGKQIVHILISDDQRIENLVVDQEFVKLDLTRQNLVSEFQSKRLNKNYLLPDENEYTDDKLVIYKLCQYFNEDDQDELESRLEKLATNCTGKNSILSSLLHCFQCNGCHLQSNEMMVFVNTILECWTVFDINPNLFDYIILSRSQSQLVDELILIKLENLMRKILRDKEKLRNLLRQITDTSVKALILQKLHESQLNIHEESFSNMLNLLPYIKNNTILLKQLDLSEWSLTLQETYWQHVLSNGGLGFTDENLEQCAFYLVKLDSLYGNELVKHVINVIKEATLFSAETLSIFVHRFYAEDMELCGDILDDFGVLNFKLSNLFEKSNKRYSGQELLELCQQKADIVTKDLSQIQDLMTKLGLSESNNRDIDRLVQMITKSHEDDNVFKHLSKIRDLLKRTADGENLVLKYIVDVINRNDKTIDTENTGSKILTCKTCCHNEKDLKRIINAIRSNIEEVKHIENCNYYILHIVNQCILLKRHFSLRDTQKLVVMLMLSNQRSLLSQVATGEGKTLIITTLCIIKCLYGEKLDIVTSCSVLAKRDAESEPPKGNKDLYEFFGVTVGHICSEDIDHRAQTFNRCDVVYGDLSSFQRDYLLDRFYGKNILGKRNFENVIVDEVDSMLLDNGNNMLYLSHDIPNMEKLQSLFIFIWKSVNQPANSSDDFNKIYGNAAIKQSIIEDIHGMIMRDEVDADVWQALLKSKTIGEDGRILIHLKDYTAHVKQLQFPKQKTENRLIFLLNIISNRQRFIKLPSEFYNSSNNIWINVDRTGLDPDLNPKIIIIDKNTGTDQSSSQWHEGLHQFLQIKHGCKLSLMSLKAVFISNVSYLKLYQNLYGLSGTLGSRDEKKLLNELYNIDLIKVPTSKPKNFFEERPIISGYKNQWTDSIYDETKKKIIKHRSVLIICETVKDVDYISKYLVKRAMEDLQYDPNNFIYDSLKKPYIYKREHEEFTFGQGNELLNCGTVIIATNLAGRGTDIKLEQKFVEAGGLHVIVTFLPNNCRIEEQAYGRAARCGEHGSGQLIVIGNDEDGGSYSSKIFQLKNVRDVYELQRLKAIKKFYDERITIEEHCFKKFQQHYEELRQYWTTTDDAKDIEKLLLDSFLDKWAFWLDENSQLIENQASHTSKKDQLFNHLNTFLTYISFDFTTWLNSSSQLLKLGNHYAKNKKYDNAEECFNKIIREYSCYLAEAHYYKSFVTIKQKTSALLKKSGQPFRQLKEDLLKAKQLFEERISDCSNDQAIVESFKKKEVNSLIHIEAFSEQQKCLSQIYNLFIHSIDDILGHSVMNNAFVNFEINEILAYDIYIKLQEQGILTKPTTAVPFSDEALIDVTMEYGIFKSALENLRHELNNNNINDSQSLIQVIDLPNIEEFWSMLKDREVLTNEIEFIIVNKQKLELVDMKEITSLVETYKMKFEFEKLQPNELIQYPIGTCEEYIFCKIELYEKLKKYDRIYLEDRCILSTNRRAKINPNEIKEEQIFDKFNSIILSDLT